MTADTRALLPDEILTVSVTALHPCPQLTLAAGDTLLWGPYGFRVRPVGTRALRKVKMDFGALLDFVVEPGAMPPSCPVEAFTPKEWEGDETEHAVRRARLQLVR